MFGSSVSKSSTWESFLSGESLTSWYRIPENYSSSLLILWSFISCCLCRCITILSISYRRTLWLEYIQPAGNFFNQHRLRFWCSERHFNEPVWQHRSGHHRRTLLAAEQCFRCQQTHFFRKWEPSLIVFCMLCYSVRFFRIRPVGTSKSTYYR